MRRSAPAAHTLPFACPTECAQFVVVIYLFLWTDKGGEKAPFWVCFSQPHLATPITLRPPVDSTGNSLFEALN